MKRKNLYVCTLCGYVGKPKKFAKGSFFIELILWILPLPGIIFSLWFLFLPALGYTLWRVFSKYKGCPKCKSTAIIPIDTPRAQAIIKELNINIDEIK